MCLWGLLKLVLFFSRNWSSETIRSLSGPSFFTWGFNLWVDCLCLLSKEGEERKAGLSVWAPHPVSQVKPAEYSNFLAYFVYLIFGCNCSKTDMIWIRILLPVLTAKIAFSVVALRNFQRSHFTTTLSLSASECHWQVCFTGSYSCSQLQGLPAMENTGVDSSIVDPGTAVMEQTERCLLKMSLALENMWRSRGLSEELWWVQVAWNVLGHNMRNRWPEPTASLLTFVPY